jgi:hypothetical protein
VLPYSFDQAFYILRGRFRVENGCEARDRERAERWMHNHRQFALESVLQATEPQYPQNWRMKRRIQVRTLRMVPRPR